LKDEHDLVDCVQEARRFLSTLDEEEENMEKDLISAACDVQWSQLKSTREIVNTIHRYDTWDIASFSVVIRCCD
jgi:uncharacterized protein with HEPN domain